MCLLRLRHSSGSLSGLCYKYWPCISLVCSPSALSLSTPISLCLASCRHQYPFQCQTHALPSHRVSPHDPRPNRLLTNPPGIDTESLAHLSAQLAHAGAALARVRDANIALKWQLWTMKAEIAQLNVRARELGGWSGVLDG